MMKFTVRVLPVTLETSARYGRSKMWVIDNMLPLIGEVIEVIQDGVDLNWFIGTTFPVYWHKSWLEFLEP